MRQLSRSEVNEFILSMPADDLLVAIVYGLAGRHRDEIFGIINGMIRLQRIFSKHLSRADKVEMIAAVRDLSDEIERPLFVN